MGKIKWNKNPFFVPSDLERQRKKKSTDFYSNCIRLDFPSQAPLTQLQANIVEWGWKKYGSNKKKEKKRKEKV